MSEKPNIDLLIDRRLLGALHGVTAETVRKWERNGDARVPQRAQRHPARYWQSECLRARAAHLTEAGSTPDAEVTPHAAA